MQLVINNMEPVKFSYDQIASKLSSFVTQKQKVRLIVFFSCFDPGRHRANLTFLKHFGVVPEEFDISKDDSVFNILSGLNINGFDGMTIIIDSVSINNILVNHSKIHNIDADATSKIPGKYQHLISAQAEKISHYLKQNQHAFTGGYVYISGFSAMPSKPEQDSLPDTEFLPWYLEVDNKSSLCRVVRQPELSFLMKKMTEVQPLIHNLDDYLEEINH